MNIAHWLERSAIRWPDRPALLHGTETRADYAAFHARATALAAHLQARGLGPGDRVGLFAKNTPDYLTALCAAWTLGAAVVPINNKLHPREAAWILQDAGAALVFTTPDPGDGLEGASPLPPIDLPRIDLHGPDFAAACTGPGAAIAPRAPDDLAWLFYTSGTTGKPKGVRITHAMLMATSLAYQVDVDRVEPTDAALYAAPMSHGAGIYAPVHIAMGAAHMVPPSGGFDPAEVLALSAAQGATSMFLAPTMVRRLLDEGRAQGLRGDGIRTIVYGGGPMYRADIEQALDWFGPKFVQIYGQGECPMAITALSRAQIADSAHPRWAERLASVGQAQSVVELRIGDDTGAPLPPGAVGEIMVRGAPVMPGYWNNPQASTKALKDGWLMTGDMGRLDAEGFLTLVDRSKDVIISGGSNIYPREVEEALLLHPDVSEVSVVGRPSPDWGEEVVAFVTPAPGRALDAAALDAHCLEHIARFKRPKAYVACDALPKNKYGKVLKTELRARLAEGG